jgi:hypothetical protein
MCKSKRGLLLLLLLLPAPCDPLHACGSCNNTSRADAMMVGSSST